MFKGLIGKKIGMTQIFDEAGVAVPITLIEAGPCYVTQVRNTKRDGYSAVQLGFGDVEDFIKRVQDIPDAELLQYLKPYTDDASAAGVLASGRVKFEQDVIKRKNALLDDFKKFYDDNGGSPAKLLVDGPSKKLRAREPLSPAGVSSQIDDAAIKRINTTLQGQSVLTDHDVFESMDMNVRTASGHVVIEGKLRQGAASEKLELMLQKLAQEQGVSVAASTRSAVSQGIPDPFHAVTLSVVKHVNTHGKTGGDGVFSTSKLDPIAGALNQFHAMDAGAQAHFKTLYEPIWKNMGVDWADFTSGSIDGYAQSLSSQVAGQTGNVYTGSKFLQTEYIPPKKVDALPSASVHQGIVVKSYGEQIGKTTVSGGTKNPGQARYSPDQTNSSLVGYNIELADGTTIFYVKQGQRQASASGTIRIVRKTSSGRAATRTDVQASLRALEQLDLPFELAGPRAVEELYLLQHFRARVMTPPPPAAGVDRVEQLQRAFESQTGVDLKASSRYNPKPQYDTVLKKDGSIERTGKSYFIRADIKPDDLRGKLTHDSSMSVDFFLKKVIDGTGGVLHPTEFRVNNAITGQGVSMSADRTSGGASYIFTRWSTTRIDNPFSSIKFVLKPAGLADRTTTVHYANDAFGKTSDFESRQIKEPADWNKSFNVRTGNERMIKNGFNVLEHIDRILVPAVNRAELVRGLQDRFGPTNPYDGRTWEEIVQ